MTRPHDAEKLGRLKDRHTALLGSTRSVSDTSRDRREESRSHLSDAVRLSGIRSWDLTEHPARLVARLELDAAALQGDGRQAGTLQAIERGLDAARAAVAARTEADRLAEQASRLQKEAADLQALVKACEAWREQPEEA